MGAAFAMIAAPIKPSDVMSNPTNTTAIRQSSPILRNPLSLHTEPKSGAVTCRVVIDKSIHEYRSKIKERPQDVPPPTPESVHPMPAVSSWPDRKNWKSYRVPRHNVLRLSRESRFASPSSREKSSQRAPAINMLPYTPFLLLL